jgi:hypothetical protein
MAAIAGAAGVNDALANDATTAALMARAALFVGSRTPVVDRNLVVDPVVVVMWVHPYRAG